MPDRESRVPKLVFFIVVSVIIFGLCAWIISSEARRTDAESRIAESRVPIEVARYEYMTNSDRQDTIRFQSFLVAVTIGWQPFMTLVAFMIWSLVVIMLVVNLRAGTLGPRENYGYPGQNRSAIVPVGEKHIPAPENDRSIGAT